MDSPEADPDWAAIEGFLTSHGAATTTYPQFTAQALVAEVIPVTPVTFRDRFTGDVRTPEHAQVKAFAEITAATELDIVAHNPEAAEKYGTLGPADVD